MTADEIRARRDARGMDDPLTRLRAYSAAHPERIVVGMPAHLGRDWAGRLMPCTIYGPHRGRKHVGSHGGTLRVER